MRGLRVTSHLKQEAGFRKKNVYLLMSSSDSSVSDQLSKSRHCVRKSLLQSTVCIFVFVSAEMCIKKARGGKRKKETE